MDWFSRPHSRHLCVLIFLHSQAFQILSSNMLQLIHAKTMQNHNAKSLTSFVWTHQGFHMLQVTGCHRGRVPWQMLQGGATLCCSVKILKMHKCVNQAHSRLYMSCLLIHAACQPLSKLSMFYHVLPRGCQAQARLKLNLEPFQSHPSITQPFHAFSCLLVMASLS